MSENTFLQKTASVNSESQVLKLRDLDIDTPYKVLELRHVTTKYGRSVLVQLDVGVVFLPQRYSYTDEELEEGNKTPGLHLIYRGERHIGKGNPMQIVKFVEITEL